MITKRHWQFALGFIEMSVGVMCLLYVQHALQTAKLF
jgi:hypothetical protein